jgi:hypothetical protein
MNNKREKTSVSSNKGKTIVNNERHTTKDNQSKNHQSLDDYQERDKR